MIEMEILQKMERRKCWIPAFSPLPKIFEKKSLPNICFLIMSSMVDTGFTEQIFWAMHCENGALIHLPEESTQISLHYLITLT